MNNKINNKMKGGASNVPKLGSLGNSQNSENNVVKTNPIKNSSTGLAQMHKDGKLNDFLNDMTSQVGMYFGIFFLLITMPAMPVIFYLSILYNVILLTWEKFKSLDHYK